MPEPDLLNPDGAFGHTALTREKVWTSSTYDTAVGDQVYATPDQLNLHIGEVKGSPYTSDADLFTFNTTTKRLMVAGDGGMVSGFVNVQFSAVTDSPFLTFFDDEINGGSSPSRFWVTVGIDLPATTGSHHFAIPAFYWPEGMETTLSVQGTAGTISRVDIQLWRW